MMFRSMLIVMLLLGFGLVAEVVGSEAGVATAVVMAADTGAVEGASQADRSPLEELNPARSSWQVWLGPVMIGVFGLALAFLIRRFSMGGRNGSRGGDDTRRGDDESSSNR